MGLMSASFNLAGKILRSIIYSFPIFERGSHTTSHTCLSCLVGISMNVPAFFGFKLLISLFISSAEIGEKENLQSTFTFSFMLRMLGWVSNLLIAFSTPLLLFPVIWWLLSKSLFSTIPSVSKVLSKNLLNSLQYMV